MAPRLVQQTGIADGLAQNGPQNGTVVKAAGAGLGVLWGLLKESATSTMFLGVHVLWFSWMVLGVARAKSLGEPFCPEKAMGGAWKLVAVWAVWAMGVVVEGMLAEQGQSVPVASAALGWISVAFLIRAADAGSYFFPGLRETLEKIAPTMFRTHEGLPRRRSSDKEEPSE